MLLGVGLHFINDPSFEYISSKNITDENRAERRDLARARRAGVHWSRDHLKKPVILDTGVHLIFDPTFEFQGPQDVNEDYIEVGPVKIIRISPA